jgi:NitT/TauT family transport system substrate-binding protein
MSAPRPDYRSRREFLSGLAFAGGAGLLGLAPRPAAADPPPATTRLGVAKSRRSASLGGYALRLHEGGLVKSSPQRIIAQGTDWRSLSELKEELQR